MRLEPPTRSIDGWKADLPASRKRSKAKRDPCGMQLIQMSVSNSSFAAALQQQLERHGDWVVVRVDQPDLSLDGVIIVDDGVLEKIVSGLPHPERVVLISRNQSGLLTRAWEAGIISVVFESDSPETALLAVLAAGLRVPMPPAIPSA